MRVQVSRRVEPEGEAQDVSVFELTEDALRVGLDAVELSQDLGEGAIRDAAAVGRAAPNEHAWCRSRRLQPIARLAHEARLAHACLADDGDELGPFVPDSPIEGGLEELELTVATNECRAEGWATAWPRGRDAPDKAPADDAL